MGGGGGGCGGRAAAISGKRCLEPGHGSCGMLVTLLPRWPQQPRPRHACHNTTVLATTPPCLSRPPLPPRQPITGEPLRPHSRTTPGRAPPTPRGAGPGQGPAVPALATGPSRSPPISRQAGESPAPAWHSRMHQSSGKAEWSQREGDGGGFPNLRGLPPSGTARHVSGSLGNRRGAKQTAGGIRLPKPRAAPSPTHQLLPAPPDPPPCPVPAPSRCL